MLNYNLGFIECSIICALTLKDNIGHEVIFSGTLVQSFRNLLGNFSWRFVEVAGDLKVIRNQEEDEDDVDQ